MNPPRMRATLTMTLPREVSVTVTDESDDQHGETGFVVAVAGDEPRQADMDVIPDGWVEVVFTGIDRDDRHPVLDLSGFHVDLYREDDLKAWC